MRKRCILVVEDDEHFGRQLVDLLQFLGHEVTWAKTGPEGLDGFVRKRADLVLVDLMIPGMNGVVLVRKLRSIRGGATVPVLMMSAVYRNPRMFERELRALNVLEFLAKPFSLIDLGRTIGVILDEDTAFQPADAKLTATGSWRVTGVRDAVGEGALGFERVGSFDQVRLFQMVFEAFRRHVAGRLTLLRGKSVREIFFLNGYPVWSTSDRAEERLGSVLVQRNAITHDQLTEIESLAVRDGLSFHRAALESGLVSSRRLLRAERARVRAVVVNSFAWPSGEYEFHAGDEFVDRVGIFEVNPIRCLSSAVSKHVGVNELAAEIHHRATDVLFKGGRFRELFPYVRLPESLSDLETAFASRCTIGSLFQRYPQATDDLIKSLWMLFQLRIADSVDPSELTSQEFASVKKGPMSGKLPDSVIESGPLDVTLPDQVSHPVGKAILHDYLAYMGEDLYTFLGLERDASGGEIDAAYERLRHRYSVGRLDDEVATDVRHKAKELLSRLSHAYDVLRSAPARLEYDDRLLAVETVTDEFPVAPSKLREAKTLMTRSAWIAAVPILRGLVRTHPDSPDVLACLGLSVYRLGSGDRKATQEAVGYLEEALGMQTDHRLARRYMADISRELEEMGGYDDLVAARTEIDPSEVWNA